MLTLFLAATALAGTIPACKDGALIDLNVHPTVSVDAASYGAFVLIEGGKEERPEIVTLMPPGFTASGWAFSAAGFLETRVLTRAALERGGYLRVQHGTDLDSEFERSTDCLLTYDVAPVEVKLAEAKLAEAKSKVAMQSVMVCDPEGTREHSIKASAPAAPIKIPPGQAAQGDGTLTIYVMQEGAGYSPLGEQTIKIQGGKFVSATSATPALFCDAKSFGDVCVNTEAVFALTKNAPFDISTDVDWYEMTLSRCVVSR